MTQEQKTQLISVKVKPILEEIYNILKDSNYFLEHFSHGAVYGYILGKGLNREEALWGLKVFSSMFENMSKANPEIVEKFRGTVVIGSDGKMEKESQYLSE